MAFNIQAGELPDPNGSGSDPNPGQFTFARAGGDLSESLTIRYTLSGTATPAGEGDSEADYASPPGGSGHGGVYSLTFAANEEQKTLDLTPLNDSTAEAAESVILSLRSDEDYRLGSARTATVNIEDNDGAIDLDLDSDNDNGFATPARTDQEDGIEDDAAKPGKIITVNDDDSDGDGIPDFADGYNRDGIADNADDAAAGEQFVPIILELSDGIDLSQAKLKFDYAGSDPAGVTRTGAGTAGDPYLYTLPASGMLRLWKKDGGQSRSATDDFIVSGQLYTAEQLGLSDTSRMITLWTEAVAASTNLADQRIEVSLDPDGSGSFFSADAVRLTAPGLELMTWDRETGEVYSAENVAYVSDPRPEVTVEVTEAYINSNGNLVVTVNWSVLDRLSELADNPAERVQRLTLTANGRVIGVVNNLPSLSTGSGVMPWQPNKFAINQATTFTLSPPTDPQEPNDQHSWGGQTVIIRAETSTNGAGKIGWDQSSVVLGWREESEFSPGSGRNPSGAGAIIVGDDPEGGTVYIPVIERIEQLQGSDKGSFYPMLMRIPLLDDETAEQLGLMQNGVEQELAPFAFSPTKHYVVKENENRPRIYVVTVASLPAGLTAIKPDNLGIGEQGGKLTFSLVDGSGQPITGATVEIFNDDFGLSSTPLQVPSGPVTMPVLLSYFRLLYGDKGLTVLDYYQQGGNFIEIGNVLWDFDVDYWNRTDGKVAIQIEKDIDPIQAAQYLYLGLQKSLAYPPVKNQIPLEDIDNIIASYKAAAQEAVDIVTTAANVYLNAISIANEGVDLVMTLTDLSEGNYAAAVGLLPFVPGRVLAGGKVILKKLDGTIFGSFEKLVVEAIAEAAKKTNFDEQFAVLANKLSVQQRLDLVKTGLLKSTIGSDHGALRRKMLQVGPPPAGMIRSEAHHELPWFQKDWFMAHGLDVSDPQYGRWVAADNHRRWSREYNTEWQLFIDFEPPAGYTKQQVIDKMNALKSSQNAQGELRFP